MEVEVPTRAQYIRTIMLELQRLASHLMWAGAYMPDLGHITGALYFWRDRELFLNLLELPSGSRLLYNYMRIGGVKRDLPDGFEQKTERILKLFEQRLDEYADLFENSKIRGKRQKAKYSLLFLWRQNIISIDSKDNNKKKVRKKQLLKIRSQIVRTILGRKIPNPRSFICGFI